MKIGISTYLRWMACLLKRSYPFLPFKSHFEASEVFYREAKVLFKQNRNQEALGLYLWALRMNPKNSAVLLEIGRIYLRLAEMDEAIRAFEGVLILDPSRHESHYYLGLTYLKMREYEQAAKHFADAVRTDPRANYHYQLARLLPTLNRLEEASEHAVRACELDSTPEHNLEAARLFHNLDDLVSCEQYLRAGLELDPKLDDAIWLLALVLAKQNRFEESRKFVEIAEKRSLPNRVALEKARIIELERGAPASKEALQEALASFPEDAALRAEYVRVLRNIGLYREALSECEKLVSYLDSEDQSTQRMIELLRGDLRVYEGGFRPSVKGLELSRRTEQTVLHLLEMSLPHRLSGYTTRSQYLLQNQKALGWNPVVATRPGFPLDYGVENVADSEIFSGVHYHRLAINGSPSFRKHPLDTYLQTYADQVKQIAAKVSPEIVHSTSNFKNGLVGRELARSQDLPFVYELRGLWEESQVSKGVLQSDSDRYRFFRDLEMECLQSADSVITISHGLKAELIGRGVEEQKIFVVPNAVEADSFPILSRDPSLAESLAIGSNETVIGYISSLNSYEGIDLLVRAFAVMLQSNRELKLLIVGDGEQMHSLRRLVDELNISERVLLTGAVRHSEILKYYSLIDVFVVPRLPLRVCELVPPLKPFEAMSCGRAVMVSDLAALREIVTDGETGRIFPAGDTEELARIATELCADRAGREELGRRAAEWVRRERSWRGSAETTLEAYRYAQWRLSDRSEQPLTAQSV